MVRYRLRALFRRSALDRDVDDEMRFHLVVGAGLYARTLVNLVHVDLGFQADHVLLLRLNPASSGYDDEDGTSVFYDDVSRSLSAIPGVRSVAFSQFALLSGCGRVGASSRFPTCPRKAKTGRAPTSSP